MTSDIGFIMTRHVNSPETNNYWNQSVQRIRALYPNSQIIIIDDNSQSSFVHAEQEYDNVTICQSEYPKRGELLPYIYYLKYKWFPKAVIMHDGLFFHHYIPFDMLKVPVIPLWHHPYDHENVHNILRIASHLKHNGVLKRKILEGNDVLNGFRVAPRVPLSFELCFGGQCFIQLQFLERIHAKYDLARMIPAIHCRKDRCALERILGLLFHQEYPELMRFKSIFGCINGHYRSFYYNYHEYKADIERHIIREPVIKVWTGR
jgi:hypothetical protein